MRFKTTRIPNPAARNVLVNDASLLKRIVGLAKSSPDQEAVLNVSRILAQAGYLTRNDKTVFDDDIELAVKAFQRYANLPTTGVVDLPTLKSMLRPRFDDLPDVPGPVDAPDGEGSNVLTGSASFVDNGVRWKRHNLSYSFQGFTTDLTHAEARTVLQSAFAQWSNVTPLTFTEQADADGVDIRIRFEADDGTSGTLAVATWWFSGDEIERVEIAFDEDETWSALNQTVVGQPIELFVVAVHEIGHALGLGHSSSTDAIMYAYYAPSLDALRPDDIDGIVTKYGGRDTFSPVYARGDPGDGIGGYDLKSPTDRAFAFDYDHSGRLDHVVLYRPGTGTLWILKNSGGAFSPVYAQGDPGGGIGGYDLKSPADRVFAFDYDHSGRLDHLVLYRPATGTLWILKNNGGSFSAVYAQGDPGSGIGGYDLKSPADQAFAFDYDHSGKLDHIVLYRPATGTLWILKNSGGAFSSVYAQGDPGGGIGGYDLKSPADQAFAFDYDHSGRLDHLALYRPGTGTLWILKNEGGTFSAVYAQGDPGGGIGGYDLRSPADRAFAFDYDHSGRLDHLALYRPGTGTLWILKNRHGSFSRVYAQGDPGSGVGGYDLKSSADRMFAFDYDHSGKPDHLALYRPGTGTFWIVKRF